MARQLLPSLKERQRYVGFEVLCEKQVPYDVIAKAIMDSYLSLFGTVGAGEAGLNIMKDNYNENKGIIRVDNKCVHNLKASLALIRNIDKAIVKSTITSGNIGKVKKNNWGE